MMSNTFEDYCEEWDDRWEECSGYEESLLREDDKALSDFLSAKCENVVINQITLRNKE